MKRNATILLLAFLIMANCFGQKGNRAMSSTYSNWMSVDYMNCLKTDLPCECEKSNEYFLINLDAAKEFVLLYDGRRNYDYNLYNFKPNSSGDLEVYRIQYSQTLFRDTTIIVGQIKIKKDALLFTLPSGRQTKFARYNSGMNDGYLNEHIKILNAAFSARGYDNLNKTLKSDSLKCFCNWELGAVNLTYNKQAEWILEKKGKDLHIYQWTNASDDKPAEIRIEKLFVKVLKW